MYIVLAVIFGQGRRKPTQHLRGQANAKIEISPGINLL